MQRASNRTGHSFRRTACIGAVAMGLATTAGVWWLVKPSAAKRHDLAAVVRQRGLFDGDQSAKQDLALAELLSEESLTLALRESHFETDSQAISDRADTIESVRERLRLDIGKLDEEGKQAITIRWTGASSSPAARLVNALARRLLKSGAGAGDLASDGADRAQQARQLESAYTEASQAANEAEGHFSEARRQFEMALAALRMTERATDAAAPAPNVASPGEPTLAPPREALADGGMLFRQQLADLENRRQELSERLMPEHPEMKSLDEKIFVLRSRLAQQPPVQAARTPPRPVPARLATPSAGDDIRKAAGALAMFAERLTAAEADYATAIDRQRAVWQSLCAARSRSVAELEPARFTPPPPDRTWILAFIAMSCGASSGALAWFVWPVRRLTFNTVEEVRAVTRLPAISVSRHSLN